MINVGNAFTPHDRVTADPVGKSRTKQAFKDEVDINHILRKHEKGLVTDHLNRYEGKYGDFIVAGDFHAHMNQIQEATEAFMTIPAEIRAKFNNDPGEFLAFAQDADNLDEMRTMGLAPQEGSNAAPEPPTAPPAVNQTSHLDDQPVAPVTTPPVEPPSQP